MSKAKRSRRLGPPITKNVPPHRFPPPGQYEIFNEPIFLIRRGEHEELLKCEGRLVVETSEANKTRAGVRQINLKVLDWQASGNSRLLEGEVKFVVTKGLKANVLAGSGRADFPGKMTVSVRAQTFLNDQLVDEHQSRVAGHIAGFPPREGDLFDISWGGIQLGDISIQGVVCKCATPR